VIPLLNYGLIIPYSNHALIIIAREIQWYFSLRLEWVSDRLKAVSGKIFLDKSLVYLMMSCFFWHRGISFQAPMSHLFLIRIYLGFSNINGRATFFWLHYTIVIMLIKKVI